MRQRGERGPGAGGTDARYGRRRGGCRAGTTAQQACPGQPVPAPRCWAAGAQPGRGRTGCAIGRDSQGSLPCVCSRGLSQRTTVTHYCLSLSSREAAWRRDERAKPGVPLLAPRTGRPAARLATQSSSCRRIGGCRSPAAGREDGFFRFFSEAGGAAAAAAGRVFAARCLRSRPGAGISRRAGCEGTARPQRAQCVPSHASSCLNRPLGRKARRRRAQGPAQGRRRASALAHMCGACAGTRTPRAGRVLG